MLTCQDCKECVKKGIYHYCIAEDGNQRLGVQNLAFDSTDCSLFEGK